VAGEVVDLAYPAGREFFPVAVEGIEAKFSDALRVLAPALGFLLWGEAFPVFWKLVVFCCLKTACSFAASVRAARAQPPLVMPLSAARRVISSNVELSTEVLMRTESLPGPLVFLGMESTSKIFKVFQFFCLTLIRFLIRNLATGVNAPGKQMKTIQTQVPAEVDLIITALAKRQMVSRAAIVRQLLVKAVAKSKAQEGQI
jgi:hypothetical protein